MNVFSHGVGTSCNGNEYHHTVYHLVDGSTTLCGVTIKKVNWWRDWLMTPKDFTVDHHGHIHSGDVVICQKCARKYDKRRGVFE